MRIDLDGDRGYWHPEYTRTEIGRPQVGWLIGLDHEVWRIVEVTDYPEDRWTEEQRQRVRSRGRKLTPVHVLLRPARHDSPDPVRLRERDRSVSAVPLLTQWWVYPDGHYPVCAQCGEPPPCREVYGRAVARSALAKLRPYETPGVCPACQEPVTQRQKSVTFPDNIMIPAGPPLTYHLRGRCVWNARDYEQKWVERDPQRRRTTLSCPGFLTNHNDGTYDCTAFAECRGPAAAHVGGYSVCRCPSCHATGRFDCHPRPNARRNTGR